jgi:hypothetical protein
MDADLRRHDEVDLPIGQCQDCSTAAIHAVTGTTGGLGDCFAAMTY